ncbi:hypothetical protein JCM8547_008484 [Rhodosporidiobolus lusitaniae]
MDWNANNYLGEDSANGDYLASLASFLDGSSASFPPSLSPSNLAGATGGLDLASAGTTSKGLPPSFDGQFNALPSLNDIQINPSLLGGLNHANFANLNLPGGPGLNGNNEPSSPELTSASDSGASPASSAGAPAPQVPQPAPPKATGPRKTSGNQHDKRKAPAAPHGAVKDRKSLGDASGVGHSHPSTGEDDEHERSESPEVPGAKGKGKTSERRRAQNRQAQRNFRERKEKHLKDLETRVLDLESRTTTQESENTALKALLEQLRAENARLKVFESAFSFNYKDDVNGSAAMPQAQEFGGLPSLPSVPGVQVGLGGLPLPADQQQQQQQQQQKVGEKPLTPPTAQDELDDVSGFKFDTSVLGFGLPSTSSAPSSAASVTGGSSLFTASPAATNTDDLFASFTLPSPPSSHGGNASLSFSAASQSGGSNLPSPSDGSTSAAGVQSFTAYRDPLAALGSTVQSPGLSTFADLDALFGNTSATGSGVSPSAGLTSEDPLAFLSAPSSSTSPSSSSAPLGASPSMFASAGVPSPGAVGGVEGQKHYEGVCTLFNEAKQLVKDRQGGKYEFDLDGLCTEMKLKATCQEAARQALKSAMAEDAAASRAAYPNSGI